MTGFISSICKGAVEEVFAACTHYAIDGETGAPRCEPLRLGEGDDGEAQRRRVSGRRRRLQGDAADADGYSVADEADLTLLGYIAFLDPPKETCAAAHRHAEGQRRAGEDPDRRQRHRHAQDLPRSRAAGGPHRSRQRDRDDCRRDELAEPGRDAPPCSPSSRRRRRRAIIDALHRKGHVVGFLGDGINDGPALKAADVGISVDSAVDIAKESADIILLEKSLVVLGEGVIEGRKVFGNIIKYIKMGASSNFGNMFSVLGASVFLPFLPMAPIQVLTNNLLYDFSQTTIPTDNVDAEYLAVPRRWDIGNITKFMLFIGPISSIFDYVTFS